MQDPARPLPPPAQGDSESAAKPPAASDGNGSDREIVEQCLGHHEAAWEIVIKRYRRRVFGMAYKFTGRFEEAEDLTQDIFLKAFRALESYDRAQDFFAWLAGITRNACIDHYRRARRERLVLSGSLTEMQEVPSASFSPYGRAETAETARLVRQGLSELPGGLRSVLVLRDLRGLSYREIALQLALSEGTVKSRIHRGRAELARKIRGRGAGDGAERSGAGVAGNE